MQTASLTASVTIADSLTREHRQKAMNENKLMREFDQMDHLEARRSAHLDYVTIRINLRDLKAKPFFSVFDHPDTVRWILRRENPTGQMKTLQEYITGTATTVTPTKVTPTKVTRCGRCDITIDEQFLDCYCETKNPRPWETCMICGDLRSAWQTCSCVAA